MRQLCDEFVDNLDSGKITCAVFLDLSKAFDNVNHQILIKKTGRIWYLWIASTASH